MGPLLHDHRGARAVKSIPEKRFAGYGVDGIISDNASLLRRTLTT